MNYLGGNYKLKRLRMKLVWGKWCWEQTKMDCSPLWRIRVGAKVSIQILGNIWGGRIFLQIPGMLNSLEFIPQGQEGFLGISRSILNLQLSAHKHKDGLNPCGKWEWAGNRAGVGTSRSWGEGLRVMDKPLLNSRDLWQNHLVKFKVCFRKKLVFFPGINHFQLIVAGFVRELSKFFGLLETPFVQALIWLWELSHVLEEGWENSSYKLSRFIECQRENARKIQVFHAQCHGLGICRPEISDWRHFPLQHEGIPAGHEENLLSCAVTGHWNWLSMEGVGSPSLGMFQICLDAILCQGSGAGTGTRWSHWIHPRMAPFHPDMLWTSGNLVFLWGQVVQRGCGILILEDPQNPPGLSHLGQSWTIFQLQLFPNSMPRPQGAFSRLPKWDKGLEITNRAFILF